MSSTDNIMNSVKIKQEEHTDALLDVPGMVYGENAGCKVESDDFKNKVKVEDIIISSASGVTGVDTLSLIVKKNDSNLAYEDTNTDTDFAFNIVPIVENHHQSLNEIKSEKCVNSRTGGPKAMNRLTPILPKALNSADSGAAGYLPLKDVCNDNNSNQHGHFAQDLRSDEMYQCQYCNKAFSKKSSFTGHMRAHTGNKPYKCDICKEAFIQQVHLTKHMMTHGVKPYKCDVCGKAFSHIATLNRHSMVHTGEKPYQCELCNKAFSQRSILTEHMRIHTGEKPYKCKLCSKAFRTNSTLYNHNRTAGHVLVLRNVIA